MTIPDVDHADILNPILREKGIRSLLGVPLLVEGRVTGVLHVGTLTPRDFTADDRNLLQLAADRAATAIEHARLFQQRRVVEILQRSIVPERPPAVPGIEVATRYRPATLRGGIGGDWYDVFPLPHGHVALAIGDVMGHGIGAAAAMAQVRTGLRAYAIEGHPPAEIAERMNRLAMSLDAHRMTTFAYLVVDLDRPARCARSTPATCRRSSAARRRGRATCRWRATCRSASARPPATTSTSSTCRPAARS